MRDNLLLSFQCKSKTEKGFHLITLSCKGRTVNSQKFIFFKQKTFFYLLLFPHLKVTKNLKIWHFPWTEMKADFVFAICWPSHNLSPIRKLGSKNKTNSSGENPLTLSLCFPAFIQLVSLHTWPTLLTFFLSVSSSLHPALSLSNYKRLRRAYSRHLSVFSSLTLPVYRLNT